MKYFDLRREPDATDVLVILTFILYVTTSLIFDTLWAPGFIVALIGSMPARIRIYGLLFSRDLRDPS